MNEPAPETSSMTTPWAAVVRWLPTADWLVIGWVIATEVLLLIFGVRSFHMIEDKRVSAHLGWLEIWNRWDALHFQRIAEAGYSASDKLKAWFYPLYPWCVRWTSYLTANSLIAAFIVSGIALLIAAVIFRRLIALDFSDDIARRGVWFFLIFPTAFYLHIGYTESLFLAFALGSVFAARKERWCFAGVLGALSWATRANGLILLPTLAIEAGHQWYLQKRWRWQWLWIGIVPAGFAVYLFLNWRISGNPFAFLKMRKELFHMSFSWPWNGIADAYRNLHRNPNQGEIVGGEELFATILTFICAVVSWFKLRPSYATWITGNWILLVSVTFIESMPRYAITMFPIFILFGILGKSRFWFGVLTFWSILMLAVLSSLFIRGWWVF